MLAVDGLRVLRWPARRPGAPLVLAIHDLTANAAHWGLVAAALDGRVDLVAHDLRGRCGSWAAAGSTPHDHVEDARAVAAALDRRVDLVAGHGFGAGVALAYATAGSGRRPLVVAVDGPIQADPDAADPSGLLDPSSARLGLTFPHRDAYLAWWRAQPWLGADGYDRLTRSALTADLVGSGFGWQVKVDRSTVAEDAAAAMRGMRTSAASLDRAVVATAGHGPDDPPLLGARSGSTETHTIEATHAALLLRREPAGSLAEDLVARALG